ncbi:MULTISPECIES: TFIIB-type zinc ribbon-containing protein [Halobacteriaceae]|uniref:TFIIB-type domain-containing protein n=1 Tax=Halanaeroarchaeum sulfurireducens TaxID=1604004 RepID=A0A0F7PD93_9EURY|nr:MULTISPECIES: TFIIB-type zinc ribbon-containing protein [Halobacteriaceae]AKH98652.1 hypothetical protein HLASF_3026 [Halanaeroarchaeum sulfurireducens]ALG83095.1 hypothetical protein HLASA_3027 [Halanaeroarchaeum sulfurireducens]MDR5657857.1 TFIIB-type zinc ribbon-containing protein [Halodesulfurarchaeum sp. HSR-GB]
MPCSECGHLLLVNHDAEKLVCPNCLGLEIEDRDIVEEKAERDRDLLQDENLVQLLEDYSKDHLLLYLIERLNKVSYDFYENRRLNMKEFAYINYLINIVYPVDKNEFGNQHLERGEEPDDDIDTLLSTQAKLVMALNHVEDRFRLCLEYSVPMRDGKFLFADYDLRDTEYRYCFQRCLRSLIGGREEDVELFDKTHQEIRDFDRPSSDEIDTLEDFGDTFYGFILSMLFVASADSIVGDIYGTSLPDHVSVFDLTELFDRLDGQFITEEGDVALQDSTLAWTNEDGLTQAGEATFGDDWEEVRDYIVVGKDNLDAHPFLFELSITDVYYQQPGRPPMTRKLTRFVYPRWYAKLLRFQIFPLLQNGEKPSSHEILNTVSTRRGEAFEENLYEYLSGQGFECYHSAEIPGENSSEIDLLVVNDAEGELWFIECKYLMPELLMRTAEGVEALNGKFDHKVFNIEADGYEGSPTGLPFPEKVDTWLALDPGDRFTAQDEQGEKTEHEFQDDWQDLTVRKLVVSNLVPSYVEKNGVEFRTDMELLEMIEDEDRVFTVKH